MKTDSEVYTLLGADAGILSTLTAGVRVQGPYRFEALEVKGLNRRTDGVLVPDDEDQPIWVIEFQAQKEPKIYHRLLIEMGLVGERYPGRVVRGLILFATRGVDPKTQPWHAAGKASDAPVRIAYLGPILEALERRDPDHPLLAACLPYRVVDRDRLRRQGPTALARIRDARLSPGAREALFSVFWSWMAERFHEMSYREVFTMFGNLAAFQQTQMYKDLVEIGREEGRDEGRREEAVALILRQAKRRFGSLSPELVEGIQALSLDRLEGLAEDLLDLTSVAELRDRVALG